MAKYFFIGLFFLSLNTAAQVKLSNGLTYKIHSAEPGKQANYYIQDVSKMKTDTTMGRFIVKFKSDPETKAKAKKIKSNAESEHRNFTEDLKRIESIHRQKNSKAFRESKVHLHFKNAFNGKSITASASVIEEIRKLPYVHYIVEDKKIKVSDETSNSIIEANKVWNQLNLTGKGVVIGIIDTGIDYTHPDISDGIGTGHKVLGGYDFVNDDNDPMDDHGHGTHVSGISAANGPNLRGVAPDAKLMGFKVLTADGWGYTSWIIGGIERCLDPDQNPNTDDKVDVANMSLGGPTNGPDPMSEAVDNAVLGGVVFAVAAGNDGYGGYQTIGSPGIAQNAITVGATDSNDQLAPFSSKGPAAGSFALKPDLTAPGVNIYSSLPGENYASWSGTSMATPHVTGAIALLLQQHPTWSPDQIKAVLMQNTVPVDGGVFDIGAGRLDILNAASATFSVSPASISLGALDKSQAISTTTFQLKVSNFSGQTKTFKLASSGDLNLPGVTTTIDKTSFTLSGNVSKVVNVTVAIQTASMTTKDLPDLYLGAISVTDNSTFYKVPVGFVNPELMTVHFDQPLPYFLAVAGANSYFFKFYFPTTEYLNIVLPQGDYNFISLYDGSFVAKENISVPATSSLSMSKSDAVNRIVFQPKDETGQKIPLRGDMMGQASIYLNQPGGAGIASIWFGLVDTLFTSNLSTNWNVSFRMYHNITPGSNKLYNIGGAETGITESKLISNNPEDLVAVDYQYQHAPGSTVGLTSIINSAFGSMFFSLFNTKTDIPSNFVEYHQRMDTNDPVISTQQDIMGATNSGYNFQTPAISIYKNDSVAFHKTVFSTLTESKKLSSPSLSLNLNETLLQWGAGMANEENMVMANPANYDGYFINNRGDKVLGKINYALSNSSGLVASSYVFNPGQGQVYPWDNNRYILIDNLQPDSYSLKVDFEDYQVQGKYGKASTELHFNLSRDDKNPPFLTQFELSVNNQFTNHFLQGDAAVLSVLIGDECYPFNYPCVGTNSGVAGYSVEYKKLADTDWTNLSLLGISSILPTNLSEGFYSLRVKAVDNAGNDFIYTLEPAFLIGVNPNPTPFQKPTLVFPENHSKLIPQNTIFKWTTLENVVQYHLEVSPDSTFADVFQSGDYTADSIRLDVELYSKTQYFWRVKGTYENGTTTPWSNAFSFTTGVGSTTLVQLIYPSNHSTDLPGIFTFLWTEVPGANGYQLQYGETLNGVDYVYFDNFIYTNSQLAYFWPGRNFFWRVKPVYEEINGEWSTKFSFSTGLPIISVVNPANNATDIPTTTSLNWADTFFGGLYHVRVSTSPDFSNLLVDQEVYYATSYFLDNLQLETTYYWNITAIYPDVPSVESDTWSFQTQIPASYIELISPSNQSTDQDFNLTFKWQALSFETEYSLMLATSADFSNATIIKTTATEATVNNLDPFTNYFWKVGVTYLDIDYWSDTFSFTTKLAPLNVELISPTNQSIDQDFNLTFKWQALPFETEYSLMLATSADFSNAITIKTTAAEATLNNLDPFTNYFWKVGVTYLGIDYWSDTFSFTTKLPLLNIELLSPADGSIDQKLNPSFTWNPLSFQTNYKFVLSATQNFSNPTTSVVSSTETIADNLQPLTEYYWKVGVNYSGTDYWSSTYSFRTIQVLGVEEGKTTKVYPNPATTTVNFEFESADHDVTIINSLGQLVWSHKGSESEVDWSLAGIESGIYVAQIKDGAKNLNKKIVIYR